MTTITSRTSLHTVPELAAQLRVDSILRSTSAGSGAYSGNGRPHRG